MDPYLLEQISMLKRAKPKKPKPDDKRFLPFHDEYCEIAARLTACGFTMKDLSYIFGCCVDTIKGWKERYPQFAEAMEDGKRQTKKQLVATGLRLATGYDYCDKNIKKTKKKTGVDENGNPIYSETIIESEFHKHQPGNDRMLVFLLCNLDRQLGDTEWQSIRQIEVKKNENIHVQIDGEVASDQIAKLAGKLLNEPPRKQIESREVRLPEDDGRVSENTEG